jgi:hypothetical protein
LLKVESVLARDAKNLEEASRPLRSLANFAKTDPGIARRKVMLATIAVLISAPMAVDLYVQKKAIKAGEDFSFSVAVKNKSGLDLTLAGLVDGCDTGRRGPSARFEVKLADKWEPLKYAVGRCGNTNPLTQLDFFTIPAGKNGTLLKGPGWFPASRYSQLGKPGKYEVRFVYDTTVPFERWIGGPVVEAEKERIKREFQDEYDRVPKGVFVSTPILVKVE